MRHINCVLKPATIENAKPKDKRYDLTDRGGLVLEVMPSGSNDLPRSTDGANSRCSFSAEQLQPVVTNCRRRPTTDCLPSLTTARKALPPTVELDRCCSNDGNGSKINLGT